MKHKQAIFPGIVVQISPDVESKAFAHCFMTVTDVKGWGVQGYIESPGEGLAYYRAKWEEFEIIGLAEWFKDDIELSQDVLTSFSYVDGQKGFKIFRARKQDNPNEGKDGRTEG